MESLAENVKEDGGRIGLSLSLLLQASITPHERIVEISSRLFFIKLAVLRINFQAKNGFAKPVICIILY